MEVPDNNKAEGRDGQPDDKLDFIQEFIDQKKLQNRVLQEILDKIIEAEQQNLSQTTGKKQKS